MNLSICRILNVSTIFLQFWSTALVSMKGTFQEAQHRPTVNALPIRRYVYRHVRDKYLYLYLYVYVYVYVYVYRS